MQTQMFVYAMVAMSLGGAALIFALTVTVLAFKTGFELSRSADPRQLRASSSASLDCCQQQATFA